MSNHNVELTNNSSSNDSDATPNEVEDRAISLIKLTQEKMRLFEAGMNRLQNIMKRSTLEKDILERRVSDLDSISEEESFKLKSKHFLNKIVTEETQLADILYKLVSEYRRRGGHAAGEQTLTSMFSKVKDLSKYILSFKRKTRNIENMIDDNSLKLHRLTERKKQLLMTIENSEKKQPSNVTTEKPDPQFLKEQKELKAILYLCQRVVFISKVDFFAKEFSNWVLSLGDDLPD